MSRPAGWPAGWFSPACLPALPELPAASAEAYWQGVWRRLRGNPRALAAAAFLLLVLAFTGIGPWLWPLDPARQDPGALSRAYMPARTVPVAMPDAWQPPQAPLLQPMRPAAALAAPAGLQAVQATTDAVRLVWQPVAGARQYHLYRREGDGPGLGIPLGSVAATQHGYEDRLDLHAQAYRYTVVAADGLEESPQHATLTVVSQAVISLLDAQLKGLVPVDATLHGQLTVALPAHPLGTDYLGRDLLARLMAGARTSFLIGLGAPLLFILMGCCYGAFAAYAGGRVDEWMMRFADFVIALPFLLFMILLRVAFGIGAGESGVVPLILAMVLLGWPMAARLVRGQVLQLRERPFVAAARLMGASPWYLVWRHMIPNVMGVVIVSLTFAIPGAIFTEAFLSFIGMGVVPPTPSWGSLCNDGIQSMLTHPHELLYPAVLISLTVLAFNLLGDGLRDALDTNLERGT